MSRRGDNYHRCPTCNAPLILMGYDKHGQVYRCEQCMADTLLMKNGSIMYPSAHSSATPEPPLSDAWREAIEELPLDDF